MILVQHPFEGMYAKPLHHPVTCANPAPWRIAEIKIESHHELGYATWIRGKESMWFRLDQCMIVYPNEVDLC